MKHFKHKTTGEVVTYNEGILRTNNFCIDLGVEPSSLIWEEISPPKDEYPLGYKDLIKGNYYTTTYLDQGLYTFKEGYSLWISHEYKTIHNHDGNFTPSNGFQTFRNATPEEIKMLYL